MDNKKNSNNRISKIFLPCAVVLAIYVLFATPFLHTGNSHEMLSVYATAESTEENVAPTETDTEPTATPDDLNTSTIEPTVKPTSSPEETEKPDATETSEPEDTEEPATETPSDTSESVKPTDAQTDSPVPTGSISATTFPTNTARPTPSPTLAGIEAPYVSGDVFVDVEDENYTPTVAPQSTEAIDTGTSIGKTEPSSNPSAVKERGNLSTFFDVMVYIFVGCAVLTAGYAVFIAVKLFKEKKKNRNDISTTVKEEKSDE